MRRIILLILSTLLLAGCLSPIKTPPQSLYTLVSYPLTTDAVKKTTRHATLLLTTPMASPGYQTSDMIYVHVPYQLNAFSDHHWVAPPADLLLPLLIEKLRVTGNFSAVVSTPFSGNATYQLNTQLLMLQQEFLQPQSEVRLVMSATLMNIATGRIIGNRIFTVLVPASANNPYAGVLATNQAAHQIVAQIARFVRHHVLFNPTR